MALLQQDFLFDDRYRLLRKLGEGGYSEVWLVEDTKARITLVLKIFLPTAQLDDSAVEIFRKEFSLVYNINHPNLLKYSFFDICVGYPYLVMPYYSDGSAEELIGRCNESTAWRYLRDVAAGLACLHKHHPAIIHQDIKPANVLLDDSNFIITDFGISSSVHSLFMRTEEGEHSIQGTRAYMPPEKFLENPQLLVENDIWSLGASLYELLTGKLPFGGKGGQCQLEGMNIPSLPSSYSNDLQYVIRKCLSQNPWHRPSAKELSKYADKMLSEGRPAHVVHAVPTSTPPPTPTSPPPTQIYDSQYDYNSIHKSSNTKDSNNYFRWLIAAVSIVGIAVLAIVFYFISRDDDTDAIFGSIVKTEQTDQIDQTDQTGKTDPPVTKNSGVKSNKAKKVKGNKGSIFLETNNSADEEPGVEERVYQHAKSTKGNTSVSTSYQSYDGEDY